MEESSRLVGVTSLRLRLGDHHVRVASDSRKGVQLLKSALADILLDDESDAELAFMLNGPRSLQRSHFLLDRSGVVVSQNRGLEAGLSALAGHLTAFLPTSDGRIRVRGRVIIKGNYAILCMSPVLEFPRLSERNLARNGLKMIDRLAVDIDPDSVWVRQEQVPWTGLVGLGFGPGHADVHCRMPIGAILVAVPSSVASPTSCNLAAHVAANAIGGSPSEILAGCAALVRNVQVARVGLSGGEAELVETIHRLD